MTVSGVRRDGRLAVGILAALWLAWTVWAGRSVVGALSDDAYITLRYAQNLARGDGLVFNPGERVFGCTEPLLAVLLGLAHRATGWSFPTLAATFHASSLLATALLILVASRRHGSLLASGVGGSLLLGMPFFWSVQGFAWPWVSALLGLAALTAGRAPVAAGLLAGLAAGFRPDALAGAGLLVLFTWLEDRRGAVRLAVATAVVVGVLALAAWWWFGSPLPSTLAAKQAYADAFARGEAKSGLGFWRTGWPRLRGDFGGVVAPLVIGCGLVGLWRARRADPVSRLLAATGAAIAVAYPLLGVSYWPWYSALPTLALVLGLASWLDGRSGVAATARAPEGGDEEASAAEVARARETATARVANVANPRWWPAALRVAAVLLLIAPAATLLEWRRGLHPGPRVELYRRVGDWIDAAAPRRATLVAAEVGTLAFHAQRPVEDLFALVSPENLARVRASRLGLADSDADAVVVVDGGRLVDDTRLPWFVRRFVALETIEVGGDSATVYVRRRAERRWRLER